MSLLATTAQAVETAFAAAGDLIAPVTWRKTVPGDYDVATGIQGGAESEQSVRAAVGSFSAAEVAKAGLSQHAVKLFIPAVDFARGDPASEDKFVHDGTVYTAKRADWEGAKVLWEIWGDIG